MDDANLYRLIASRFPADPSRPVIEDAQGRLYGWHDMDRMSARFAATLASLGCVKGDRIAVQVDKSPEALFLYLACLRGGFVFLPLNTAYRAGEVEYMIGDAGPAVMVASPAVVADAETAARRHGCRHVLTLTAGGEGSFPALVPTAPCPDVPCAADDVAAILYTSGTTGRPKGAMLSHRNLAANGEALRTSWAFTAGDVLLHALPVFHAHGLFVACHCVLLSGARMLWLPAFDQRQVMACLPRATVFMGVPTYYTRLLAGADFTAETCAGVRLFVSGSAPLSPETFLAFRQRTGHAILERYGMTETGMNTSNPYRGERRPGSVGRPLPGVSVRVAGPEGGILPPGAVGVLQVRGENVFAGYWRRPDKTAEDFTPDGWFITGDLARIDDDGVVTLVGRARDLIISGGYNVYPREVEQVIDRLEGVVESVVIGLPHPDFGEAVVAIVQARFPAPAPETVMEHARAHLAKYKVPKAVLFVEALPRNAMGKVQKNLLRQTHAAEFAS
ncbi:MAG: malonyl-CoA synthase [Rhodospirillaceae bacterium]|nr:MAG: malonyl-CoA synthase [Rhodospirillaceae bacterium]